MTEKMRAGLALDTTFVPGRGEDANFGVYVDLVGNLKQTVTWYKSRGI